MFICVCALCCVHQQTEKNKVSVLFWPVVKSFQSSSLCHDVCTKLNRGILLNIKLFERKEKGK